MTRPGVRHARLSRAGRRRTARPTRLDVDRLPDATDDVRLGLQPPVDGVAVREVDDHHRPDHAIALVKQRDAAQHVAALDELVAARDVRLARRQAAVQCPTVTAGRSNRLIVGRGNTNFASPPTSTNRTPALLFRC
jgi:hypothetical protein